jgi:hypothetical protein
MRIEDACFDKAKIQKQNDNEIESYSQTFYALMPFKIREILLVSSFYDAFIVEEEGLISEMVIKEYRHLLLSSPPRITHVISGEEALSKLKKQSYDLVITMSKNIGMDPFIFGRKIKKICQDLPVIILATDTADLHVCQERIEEKGIDKAFYWHGDSSLFMAIVKYIEDKINVKYDTKNGNVQVIIVLEDSIRDYSMLLPIIYSEIVRQTQRSISDDLNEMQRLLRRRARPKILLTDEYDEGIKLYEKYKRYLLGIISDVKFLRRGNIDDNAGHHFIKQVKEDIPYLPTMLQSTEPKNRRRAEEVGSYFVNKNSPTIVQDIEHFLLKHLGFGDFVFLQPKKDHKKVEMNKTNHLQTVEITRASNLEEFEKALQKIPLESIKFHANHNDFSNWLMARCEFKLAKKLRPQKVSDFTTLDEMRKYLVNVFNESRRERQLAVMTEFSQQNFEFDSTYTKIGGESLGGKGRGIAFIRTLLSRNNLNERYTNVKITVPSTVAISTDEFDRFISENNLAKFVNDNKDIPDKEIAKQFINSKLSNELKNKLTVVLKHFKKPIAVRSSSLLEDSQNHPFAGMYSTYMLTNNHKDIKIRLKQLCKAIKLVYASVFYKDAKAYIESTSAKIEEEKMAIILQEVVGSDHNGRFYPTFSGVAQSYNYYPVSHQKRNEGIVSVAVGLGFSVVGGEKVLRFSPYHPNIIPDLSNPAMVLENTQRELYVLNTKKQHPNLTEKDSDVLQKINVSDIAEDGTLYNIASTYDKDDGIIRDYFSEQGPHLITFAGILKHNVFPLSDLLKDIVEYGQKSMGTPVEIEFAVNFDENGNAPPIFAIIQIRPLIVTQENLHVTWNENDIQKKNVLIYSKNSLGNGIIDNIKDVLLVVPETFDSSKTIEIAEEIGEINQTLKNKSYLLIGPGRWGTQDRWLGVPVFWSQISKVKVLVETALEDFNIRPTQGTHFFQNIISRGIGYINTTLNLKDSYVDWSWLKEQKSKKQLKYVKHIRLDKPIIVKLDGKNGKALVIKPK